MKYKADWPDARRRLSALWHGEPLDRPCIAVTAPQPAAALTHLPAPADHETRWLGPDYVIGSARRQLESTWWGGESIPSVLFQGGWVVSLGGEPQFSPDTIWFQTRKVDFTRPSPFRHRADDPWFSKYRVALLALCDAAGQADFLVGAPLQLPASDLLSMHMGASDFLLALMDEPDWMAAAILTGARDQLRARAELQTMVRSRHSFWYGNGGWMPFWAPEPFTSTQSDASCMLSPAMFERFVVPELDVAGREYGALWYHLDGADAKQHLPRLLSLPYLRVVQYVPTPSEPPNGEAHLELYRTIQNAGKIVHIEVPPTSIEPLLRQLDASLLVLQTHCGNRGDGERLLDQSAEWAGMG